LTGLLGIKGSTYWSKLKESAKKVKETATEAINSATIKVEVSKLKCPQCVFTTHGNFLQEVTQQVYSAGEGLVAEVYKALTETNSKWKSHPLRTSELTLTLPTMSLSDLGSRMELFTRWFT
jgi:hypothetical protein